ncbi:MAG: CYTH domain-containing protein [Candidatus Krumholzibacteriia bacterium]
MNLEIERKFLVATEAWRHEARDPLPLRQGFLLASPDLVVRVRLTAAGGTIAVKQGHSHRERSEWEYPIPASDAAELLEACPLPLIEKTRHHVDHAGRVWEVDVFHGANEGLVVAECELPAADAPLELPPWVGQEVTGDERYYNASLARRPYRDWA